MENSGKNIPKLKIVLLGDSGVGKTSLITQFVNKKFQHKGMLDLNEVLTKQVDFLDGKQAILEIQDTRGQERLGSGLEAAFFNNAKGCMLVYDVNNPTSFDSIEQWQKEFITRVNLRVDLQSFPFIVLGNKVDLLDGGRIRGVSERATTWCERKGSLRHLLTSAKDNKNVAEAFKHIAELAINYHVTNIDVPGPITPSPSKPPITPPPKVPHTHAKPSTGCCTIL